MNESPDRQTSETGLMYGAMFGMVAACLGLLLLLLLLIPVFGATIGVALLLGLAVLVGAVCVSWLRRGHHGA